MLKVSIKIRNHFQKFYTRDELKIISFIISLLTCLMSGSILLFPLISDSLILKESFKIIQVNLISSVSQLGMYLCLPVLGYLSDIYGTYLLALLAIFLLVPPYLINTLVINSDFDHTSKLMIYSITFGLIGLGTSSIYFLSLLTCSKIYPHKKGLSISLPVACYGLSSLIGSQILKLSWFHNKEGLNLSRVFQFFAILYLIVGSLNFISTSIVIEHKQSNIDENTELIPISSIEPPNHQEKFMKFLKSPVMYILLISLFLNIGPLETFQNNLNSILRLNHYKDLSKQISLLSIFSTISRLIVGITSDYVNKLFILVTILFLGIINQYLSINYDVVSLITIINGFIYGGLFTIYPTILSEIWGVDILGSTWGLFMISPAISSTIFSLIYGSLLDNFNDISQYFKLVTLSFTISFMLAIIVAVKRLKK